MTLPTLDKAIESIEILHNVKPGNINEASIFLTDLQQSNYAWSIADQLLYLNRDLITSYFGAQTMRNKIQLHFEELPVESHLSLKESLLKHLSNISNNTNHTVTTQLSLALADLFCHMVQWHNALDEIIGTFTQSEQSIPVLLDVLKYIPEEFSNRSLRLGVNRKTQIFAELDRSNRAVVNVLEQSLAVSSDSSVFVKCLECLDSWFVINLFHDGDLEHARVVPFVYDVLKRPAEATESLFKAAAQCATDFFCNDCQTIPQLTQQFQFHSYQLVDAYRSCEVSRPDYCLDYAKMFCEMGSALLPTVLEAPRFDGASSPGPGDCRTLNMLLMTARTNRDCCALVLDVLVDVTDNRNLHSADEARAHVAPLFEDLIGIMTRHCAASDNDDNDGGCGGDDDEQTLSGFRADVFFVMEQIRMFVDMETVFRRMLGDLSGLLTSGATDNGKRAEAVLCMIGSLVKFVDTDSADNASWTEQLLTQVILPCIGQAPASFQDVAFTMFGELCRWAARRPVIMDRMLSEMVAFVLASATTTTNSVTNTNNGGTITDNNKGDDNINREARQSAFNAALQSLAIFAKRQPGLILQPHRWTLIIEMCHRFPDIGGCPKKDLATFYEALGKCVCVPATGTGLAEVAAQQQPAQLAEKLWQLCQINVEIVNQLVATDRLSKVPRDNCDPCVWIDNLSALFVSMGRMVTGKHGLLQQQHRDCFEYDNVGGDANKHTNINNNSNNNIIVARQPYLVAHYAVMEQYLWPVLAGLIDCFIGDGRVLERVVRILRYSLRCYQTMTKPLLGSIAQKIVGAYAHSKESCFLYVGGILVDEFGGSGSEVDHVTGVDETSSCKQGLIQMFHAFSGPALEVLAGDGLHENPNTTEDLFRLMVRLVQRCSPEFLAWQALPVDQLLGMAVRAIPGTNIDAKTLALRFLVEAFHCANSTNESHQPVRQRATHWLHNTGACDAAVVGNGIASMGMGTANATGNSISGLCQLWRALLYVCRWRSDEITGGDLVEDMTDLVLGVRALTDRDSFLASIDGALHHVGVARRDGMLYATDCQIHQFRNAMLQYVY